MSPAEEQEHPEAPRGKKEESAKPPLDTGWWIGTLISSPEKELESSVPMHIWLSVCAEREPTESSEACIPEGHLHQSGTLLELAQKPREDFWCKESRRPNLDVCRQISRESQYML